MKASHLKKVLLAGTAIVAVGFTPNLARADEEIAGTIAVPTDLSAISAEQLLNAVDDQAAADDAAFINANGGAVTGTNIVVDTNATVGIFDGTAGGETVAFSGNADIASGVTLTLLGGGSEQDGTGTDGAGASGLTLAGNVNGGDTTSRGGVLSLIGVNNEASGTHTFAFNGSTLLTTVNVTGGNGGAAEAGTAVTGNFGDAAGDSFDVTGISVTGGGGSTVADGKTGGAAASTITGTAAIGTGGITVSGGDAEAGAGAGSTGGAAALTFNQAVDITGGAVAVNGGDDDAVNGGGATLTFNSTVESDGALTVTGGAGGAAGTAGDATVLFRGDVEFSAITLNTDEGVARLTFDVATDDTGDFEVNGAINGAAAGEGVLLISDDSAVTADTVTFNDAIGNLFAVNIINVGDGTGNEGGHGVFESTVNATTINVGAADTGNEAVTADFNDDVTATTINVVAEASAAVDATATFAGDVTAAVAFTDAGGASVATVRYDGTSAQTQTGAITTNSDNAGQVIVGNTGTNSNVSFTAAIGADAGGDIAGFTVVSGSTANIVNDIFMDSGGAAVVSANIDGTLNIDSGATAISIDDDTGDIDIDGTVSITGDNLVDFTAASDIFIDGATTFETYLTAAKTTTLSAGANLNLGTTGDTHIIAGNQIVATATTKTFISDASDETVTLGIHYQTGAVFDPDATTVVDATGGPGNVIVDTTGTEAAFVVEINEDSDEFDDGDTITVVDADDLESDVGDTTWTALITSEDVVLRDTGLVDLQDAGSAGDDLLITAVFRSASDVLDQSTAGAAQALMDVATADSTGNLETARGNLLAAADASAAHEVSEALGPTVDAGAVIAGQNFMNHTASINSTRLAMLRNGASAETGMAAGEIAHGSSFWVQGFGTMATQDARDGVDGFDADTLGVAVGADTENVADKLVIGAALSYANTDVESDNASSTDTEINSYQIAVYGDYDLDPQTYLAGQLGYVWSNNDSTRHNVGGISGVTANGDYDSNQFLARAELGRDYAMQGNAKITPKVMANYMHYDADDYTETDAGTANLNVDQESLNLFEIGAGIEASWMVKHNNGSFCEPALHAGVRHDLIGDDVQTTSSFTGGGSTFETEGFDPARTTFNVGADLTFHSTTNWDLKAAYDFEIKSDYDAHSGLLKAAYKF
ncbi:MAG: autotransporter domain-containing protein [Alphaproteobacteria bacterium]|nr:autotransporter domain-containing protein [Alphaproteobacteria bacterium]